MKKQFRKSGKFLLALAVMSSAASFCYSPSVQAADAPFTDAQKVEIEKLFMEMVAKHPDLIANSVTEYYKKQDELAKENAEKKLVDYKEFFKSNDLPMAGNPQGDVTIVEYFDYNCGYCKKAYQDIAKLLEEDKNVRVIFQEMPILRQSSQVMASIAEAAHKQGKYFEMHQALMNYNGPQTVEAFVELAKKLGLDIAKLEADAKSPEVDANIRNALEMARALGISGTPGFIIEDRIYPGYFGSYDNLKKIVDETRAAKKAAQ